MRTTASTRRRRRRRSRTILLSISMAVGGLGGPFVFARTGTATYNADV